jgi:hypothetical protein
MPDYAIFSPKMGLAESVPGMTMREAFLRDGSKNVHERYEEYHKIRGRLPDLYDLDTTPQKIAAPTDIYTITTIDTGTKTITIVGDHSAGTTALAAGDTIRVNGGTTAANNVKFTVSSLPTTSTIVTVEPLSAAGATPGNVFVGATPKICYHRHVKEKTSAEYLLIGTAYHILLWTYSDRSLAVKHTCSSACTRWEMCTHMDNVYATNNVDKVLWWNIEDSAGNNFAVLDNAANGLLIDTGNSKYITKAKHIFTFENYLFVANVTDSDSDVHPARVINASGETGGATIDFNYTDGTGDAAKKDFTNTPSEVMGFGRWGNNIIVATGPDSKYGRIYKGWLTTEKVPFYWDEEPLKTGTLSGDTMVNSKDGRLFFLATDMTIRELNNPVPVSTLIDKTIRGINLSVAEYSQATFIDRYNSIAIAVPTGSSETNDKLLCINVDKPGSWFIMDIPVRAFGDYTQQVVYTWDTLPERTYNDWGAAWLIYDTQVNVLGFHLNLCSDYSGYTYDLFRADNDDGTAFTAAMVFGTTFGPENINNYKRVNNGIDLYFTRQAEGTVTVEVNEDSAKAFETVGTASLVDTDLPDVVCVHVPTDLRAKYFQWKLSSENYFEFLGMAFPDVTIEGTR